MYLAWFDANPKKPTTQKIAEAHERYVEKFGRQPLVCLVNPEDMIADSPVELRPLQHISRHCFWIGVDEAAEAAPALVAPARTPRARKPQPEPQITPAGATAPQLPTVAPRARKPKAAPSVVAETAAIVVAPAASTASPAPRKSRATAAVPGDTPTVSAPTVAKHTRKPKAAPIAPPTPVIVPEPAVVPAPKRRTRREKVAA